MPYTILCPTDFSEASEHALEYATELARAYGGATLRLLHVDDLPTYGLPEGVLDEGPLRLAMRQRLDALAERFEDRATVEPLLARGRPATEILAQAGSAQLVVMATRRRHVLSRALLGSVSNEVVRASPAPVITIDPDMPGGRVRGLLAMVDASAASEGALDEAIAWAERIDAPLHVVHAFELPTHALPDGGHIFEPEVTSRVRDRARTSLEAVLARHPSSIRPTIHVLEGAPSAVVERVLEAHDEIGLVVMGTRGRSGLQRFLLGSVAERVLRTCPVPVMVVCREDER